MQIKSAKFVISNTDVRKCPEGNLPEYAFIGRSNVGKSSLINMLTNHKGLAMTSSTPGKTLLINHFLINEEWYLVDLPGYGYAKTGAKRRKIWSKFINEYLLSSPRIQFVCQLIDVRHEPMASDVEMFRWLVENNLPVLVIATKADKIGKNTVAKNVAAIKRGLGIPDLDVLPYSSLKNQGRQELLQVIADCLGEAEE